MFAWVFVIVEDFLVGSPKIDKFIPDFVAHCQLVFSDQRILKDKLFVIDDGIESAIVDQFLELPLLLVRQLVIFVELVLLLQEWWWFVGKIAVVCENIEDKDVADVERVFLKVIAVIDFLL